MYDIDLAYIAGFFDGEGCVGIYARTLIGKHARKQPRGRAMRVSVANTNPMVLEEIKINFGGHIKQIPATKGHYGHKPCWVWECCGRTGLVFLEAIYPFLKLKKYEAEVVIQFQKVKEERKRGFRKPMTEEEIALEEAQLILVQNAKRRVNTHV